MSMTTSDKNQEKILNSELDKEINSTCSWCGCKNDVQRRQNTFDWSENEKILCPDCYAFFLYRNVRLKDLIRLKAECSNLSEKYRSLKFKIINPQQELDFVKLEKLHYIEDKVYLETNRTGYLPYKSNIARNDFRQDYFLVEVNPVGVYTGIRDITNERVYTGDIVCHGIDSTKAPEFGINDCEFCYRVVWPDHNWCGHVSTREMKIKEWCTVNMIDGFWPVPWRALTHPIVIGHHDLKHFRKITSELNVLPENIKQKVIENIKLFQNDYHVKILEEKIYEHCEKPIIEETKEEPVIEEVKEVEEAKEETVVEEVKEEPVEITIKHIFKYTIHKIYKYLLCVSSKTNQP